MPITYSAFGLVLTCNLQIPGLIKTEAGRTPHVEIYLGTHPAQNPQDELLFFESAYVEDGSGKPALQIWKTSNRDLLHLIYRDGVQFWLDHQGRSVWATWPETSSLEEMATYLAGPVFGLLLHLRGTTCLHASAVAIEDQAAAFIGPSGSGKSTTAASLAKNGFSVFADDIVSLTERNGRFYVMPAFPFISLWPESADAVYGSHDSIPRFLPGWEKLRVGLDTSNKQFQLRPLPLGSIYLFGERTAAEGPVVEEINGREAFLRLVANTYAAVLLEPDLRAREFELLGRLIATVPVRNLRLPKAAANPDQLCKLIGNPSHT